MLPVHRLDHQMKRGHCGRGLKGQKMAQGPNAIGSTCVLLEDLTQVTSDGRW